MDNTVRQADHSNQIRRWRKLTDEAKAIKEYYETHDISIVRDAVSGELVCLVTDKVN